MFSILIFFLGSKNAMAGQLLLYRAMAMYLNPGHTGSKVSMESKKTFYPSNSKLLHGRLQ